MSGMGQEASGYGDGLFYRTSLAQAFSEAWERLWMKTLRILPPIEGVQTQNSNGFASGRTPEEALRAARGELIERAVFLTAWNNRDGWSSTSEKGLRNHILTACLAHLGWRTSLYRLREARLGDVICGLATQTRGGAIFGSCYRHPEMNLASAQSKALRSMLRTAVALDKMPDRYAPLPENGGPESHRDFYMKPEHLEAFAFLNTLPKPPTKIELGAYDDTIAQVLIDIEGFPYVAAATNPCWPRPDWGRGSIVPGGNPWPHPLA